MTSLAAAPDRSSAPQAPWTCHLLTLFPEFFNSPLAVSILGKALERDQIRVKTHDIRAHARDKHKMADDTPYGGGAGMVMKPGPVVRAMEAVDAERQAQDLPPAVRLAMTPSGEPFNQALAHKLAALPALTLVCGRYEGFDERTFDWVDGTISLGDFVLTGGEPAALVILDAVARLRPGVLGNTTSAEDESFSDGLLEYPHYTRPFEFRGHAVPAVLRSGDHGRIARWRRGQALLKTSERRPDLLDPDSLSDDDRRLLAEARQWRLDHGRAPLDSARREEGA